jgi:hypothetical protein
MQLCGLPPSPQGNLLCESVRRVHRRGLPSVDYLVLTYRCRYTSPHFLALALGFGKRPRTHSGRQIGPKEFGPKGSRPYLGPISAQKSDPVSRHGLACRFEFGEDSGHDSPGRGAGGWEGPLFRVIAKTIRSKRPIVYLCYSGTNPPKGVAKQISGCGEAPGGIREATAPPEDPGEPQMFVVVSDGKTKVWHRSNI